MNRERIEGMPLEGNRPIPERFTTRSIGFCEGQRVDIELNGLLTHCIVKSVTLSGDSEYAVTVEPDPSYPAR